MKRLIFLALIVFLVTGSAKTQPTPIYPTGTINTLTPLFDWSDYPPALMYKIQVNAGVNTVINDSTPVSQYQTPFGALAENTLYYWRVGARTGAETLWSSYYTFNIILNPVQPPTLIYPLNESVICGNSITFDWSDVVSALAYQIQIATEISFIQPVLNVSGLTNSGYTLAVGTLQYGITYFWRVRAITANGTTNWSPVWKFMLVSALPAPVITIAPPGMINTLTPYFAWNPTNGASGYRLSISTSPGFGTVMYDTLVAGLSVTLRTGVLSYNIIYYWRLAAVNVCGNGNWSSVWNFIVEETGIRQISGGVPSEFKLYDNYPNPFNQSSVIGFQCSMKSGVTLKVYDVSGKEVRTLVNEILLPGVYETTIDGSSLSSGVYFVRMTAGAFTEIKRIVLMK